MDKHALVLNISEFEIVSFCKDIVFSFEGYSSQNNCKLIFESNVSEAQIKFDKERLQSIITNLLSNAIKFNKENGQVIFKLELKKKQLKLEISDTGIGIDSGNLKKLGERYYQIERSDYSVEGTGIGLAFVKELTEQMKGSMKISSVLNKGTTVDIVLPCDENKVENKPLVTLEINSIPQIIEHIDDHISDNINNLPRVLIVEDNNELRLFLRDLFSKDYYVICAKDGQEGKDMAFKYLPDLIISDVMMPKITGNRLCKLLKNDINTSHITIILFTAKGSPDSIVDGFDCGADDYIVKPFDTDLLLKKVNNIMLTTENAKKKFNFLNVEHSKNIYSDIDKQFLIDCMCVIKDNLKNSSFTVDVLSEKINVHRRTLLRKCNALTGKSPNDLIKHARMTKAAELIKEGYLVKEVALLVGYEDTNRFSKAFKQFHGSSPSAYN
jgi:DNA-binding response OmpR family regulator